MLPALAWLRAAFHEPGTRSFRVASSVLWALIVLSVGLFLVEAILPRGSEARAALHWVDTGLLSVFGLEYLARVATFHPPELVVFRRPPLGRARVHVLARLRYMLQPLMLVDLITVLALVPELRGLRALRLMRLLRSRAIFRYSNPFSGLLHAFERDRLLFLLALSFILVQVLLGGSTLYLIERDHNPALNTPGDAAWWALVTITTVGFGDITPVTAVGRIVASFLMIGGLFTLATFAGIVSHSLLRAFLSVRDEQFRMGNHANHLVVCGYEDGMDLLLDALVGEFNTEETKIVVFADMERPGHIAPELDWVEGDPTKESELDKVSLARAKAVVVAGSRRISPQQADAVTLLILFTVRSHLKKQRSASRRYQPVYVVAEILDSENVEHARAAGADEVIETRRLGFSLLAHAIEHHGTADTLSQVVLRADTTLFVGDIPEEVTARTYGELVDALKLRRRGGLVIGVSDSKTGRERVNPPDSLALDPDTKVLYLAPEQLLE